MKIFLYIIQNDTHLNLTKMKHFIKSLTLCAIMIGAFSFSSFTVAENNNGNGQIVTIIDGAVFGWVADNCDAPIVPSTSARAMLVTNGFRNFTITFQLPEGHCDIPEKGATVTRYSETTWSVINSNGFVMAKLIVPPSN